jgi:hypothetical protein
MAQQDESGRAKREATPGGATGGGGIGAGAAPPDSPGNDQGGIVGSGEAWHAATGGAGKDLAGNKPLQGASQPGVMGDGTEEQNLGQPGDPKARIGKDEVDAAFAGNKKRPDYPDELVAPDDGGKS